MTDPHFESLTIEKRAETRFTRLYLTMSGKTGDHVLHIRLTGDHGLHEAETLGAELFDLDFF